MSFTLFSFALLTLFILIVAVEIYRMLHRDTVRSLLSGATVLLSVLCSMILSPIISIAIINVLYANINRIPVLATFLKNSGHLAHLLIALVCIALSVLLFLIVFFLLRILFGMIISILYRTLLKKASGDAGFASEGDSWFDRNRKVINVLIGVLNAFVIMVVITMPIMGTFGVVSRTIGIAEKIDEDIWKVNKTTAETVEGLKRYSNDAVGSVFYQCGGTHMFSAVATTMLYDETVYLDNEMDHLEGMAESLSTVFPIFTDPQSATDEHVAALENFCVHLEQMKLSKPLLAEYISKGAGAWLRGNLFYGVPKPTLNEVIDPTFDELLRVCAGVNIYNAQRNTVSLFRIYGIIIDSGLLRLQSYDYETLTAFLQETHIIERLSEELSKNPDMSGINDSVSAIAIGVMALQLEQMNLDDLAYDGLMSDIADAVESVKNLEDLGERIDTLSNYTQDFLGEHDVSIPENVARYAAEKMLEILASEPGTVDAARIEEFFKNYQP